MPQLGVNMSDPTPILTIATSNVVYNPMAFQTIDTHSPKSIDTIKTVTSETGRDGKRPQFELRHILNESSPTLVTEDAIVSAVCQDISKKMTFATNPSLKREN